MMNQLRHNFTKSDCLSLQLTPLVQIFSAQFLRQNDYPSASITYVKQCDWQSATYEGEIRHYTIELLWDKNIINPNIKNDFIAALICHLDNHEFDILRSFVAGITVKHSNIIAKNRLSLEIKVHIIHEE